MFRRDFPHGNKWWRHCQTRVSIFFFFTLPSKPHLGYKSNEYNYKHVISIYYSKISLHIYLSSSGITTTTTTLLCYIPSRLASGWGSGLCAPTPAAAPAQRMHCGGLSARQRSKHRRLGALLRNPWRTLPGGQFAHAYYYTRINTIPDTLPIKILLLLLLHFVNLETNNYCIRWIIYLSWTIQPFKKLVYQQRSGCP